MVIAAELLANTTGINIECRPIENPFSHNEMLTIFSKARVYLGLSISDGIATSALEAMAYGAFPLQTSTSCIDEWIKCGITGHIIDLKNLERSAEFLIKVMHDDDLVNRAFNLNFNIIKEKASKTKVSKIAKSFYELAIEKK